jgi:hypothetical protein
VSSELIDFDEMMRAYAEEARSFAASEFDAELGYDEVSLELVDEILGAIHNALPLREDGTLPEDSPLQEWLQEMAMMWGAYLGEVILLYWEGEWTMDVSAFNGAGLALHVGNAYVYPISKIYERLLRADAAHVISFFDELMWRLSESERMTHEPPATAA